MPSDLPAKPLPLGPAYEEDAGISEGARLGAPRPDWAEEEARKPDDEAGQEADRPAEQVGGARRLLRAGLATLMLAAFAGLLWYAYQWGRGERGLSELPVVRADAGPEKVRPKDPGGLEVPYQDQLVLNRAVDPSAATRVERLLPPPEVPLPTPAAEPRTPDVPREIAVVPVPELPTAQPAVPAEGAPAAVDEPAPPLPPAKPAHAAADGAAAPAPQSAESTQSAQSAESAQTPAAAAVPAGSYALQLASLKNPGAAEAEWARLQASFPKLLGRRSLRLKPAEIAGVGKVYRLQAGPFASRSKAHAACVQLKQRRQDCFVVTP